MESIKEMMECPICVNLFDSDKFKPYILECGHTYCKTCITSMHKKSKNPKWFNCPTCRKKIMTDKCLTKVNLLT